MSLATATIFTATATIPIPTSTPILIHTAVPTKTVTPTASTTPLPVTQPPSPQPTVTPANISQVIGNSYDGRPIHSYRFGSGSVPVVFVGGIHGWYEWNTSLLAYQAIDYFEAYPDRIPANVTLFIIPVANPDGLFTVTQKDGRFAAEDVVDDTFPGRFNGRNVDLNRNWDCQWSETAVWRDQPVSSGSQPFSEPESRALRDYFLQKNPALVLFWHSAGDGVFAAGCPETYTPSLQLATLFGQAAGYPVYEQFPYYPITGDAGDWLATRGIPTISIELKTHEDTDWLANLAGMLAILAYYDKPVQ